MPPHAAVRELAQNAEVLHLLLQLVVPSYSCALQYMDRVYVKHQNKAPVHQLGLDLWRDLVLRWVLMSH